MHTLLSYRALDRRFCSATGGLSSEDSCSYRYHFDDRIELTAMWSAGDGSGVDGQVSITQVSVDEDDGLATLQISVFLTAAVRQASPEPGRESR